MPPGIDPPGRDDIEVKQHGHGGRRASVAKDMWRADYEGNDFVSAETVLFRIRAVIGPDGGRNSEGREISIRVHSTQQARQLAKQLLLWADLRDGFLQADVERTTCTRCGQLLMSREGMWRDEWMSDICGKFGQQLHLPPPDAPKVTPNPPKMW